ncbi:MAG: bile acid:sodium symporter family protein [Sedimenticola sp.]
MDSSIISQVVLPIALFTIMLGMGMSLLMNDFRQVVARPYTIFLGVGLQLLWLPAIGIGVVALFQLPAELGLGLIILTLAPGGATSNMITFLCRADTALSITLTAITSLITPFTLPLLAAALFQFWMGDTQAIPFPVLETMLKLVVITILPVSIGLLLNHYFPTFCKKSRKPVKVMSILFLLLIIVGIARANWDQLPAYITIVGPAVMVMVTIAIGSSFWIARRAGLFTPQALTIAIEVGIQNAGTALLVTGTVLQNPTMSASALIYGILMQIPALILIAYRTAGDRASVAV